MHPNPHPDFLRLLRTELGEREVWLSDSDLDDLAIAMLPRAEERVGNALLERLSIDDQLRVVALIDEGHDVLANQALTAAVPDLGILVASHLWTTAVEVATELEAALAGRLQ